MTVHTGSSESVARLRLFEDDSAMPGDTAWAQLKLDNPIAVAKGDYFRHTLEHDDAGRREYR